MEVKKNNERYGVIATRKIEDSEIEFLLVLPKYTPEFSFIIQWMDITTALKLIPHLTKTEWELLSNKSYAELYQILFATCNLSLLVLEQREKSRQELVLMCRETINFNASPQWEFPKGKRERHPIKSHKEKYLRYKQIYGYLLEGKQAAAFREFKEETGYDIDLLLKQQMMKSKSPIKTFNEFWEGTNGKHYSCQYYWITITSVVETSPTSPEISECKWMTAKEIEALIPPLSKTKVNIVNQIVDEYTPTMDRFTRNQKKDNQVL